MSDLASLLNLIDDCVIHKVKSRKARLIYFICTPGEDFDSLVVSHHRFFHLQVIERSRSNKMNSVNLAIVFGPNLIWSTSQAASLTDMAQINMFTRLLLDNHRYLFDKG